MKNDNLLRDVAPSWLCYIYSSSSFLDCRTTYNYDYTVIHSLTAFNVFGRSCFSCHVIYLSSSYIINTKTIQAYNFTIFFCLHNKHKVLNKNVFILPNAIHINH